MSTQPNEPLISAEERQRVQKIVDAAKVPKSAPNPALAILVHDCFNQRLILEQADGRKENLVLDGWKKEPCNCRQRVSFVQARNLIERGKADWLLYVRQHKVLEDRTSLVLTAATVEELGRHEDAMYYKRWLSLTGFENYHVGRSEQVQPGIDTAVEAVRLESIRASKRGVAARRKPHWRSRGAGPDSDESTQDIINSDSGFSARASGFAGRGKADQTPKEVRHKDGSGSAFMLGGGDTRDNRALKRHEAPLDSRDEALEAKEEEEIRLLANSGAATKASKKNFKKSSSESENA